jgi:hypothetical protein
MSLIDKFKGIQEWADNHDTFYYDTVGGWTLTIHDINGRYSATLHNRGRTLIESGFDCETAEDAAEQIRYDLDLLLT